MKRRDFLSIVFSILGISALASVAYPLIRFLIPPKEKTGIKTKIAKSDMPIGRAKEITIGTTPIIIIDRPGKGYIALSRVCTHLGCLVNYDEEKGRLICPCHAGTFDLDGRVISGPPPRSLQQLPLRVEDNEIIIG